MADTRDMRGPRNNTLGVVYHLIWRFVDRRWFFRDDDERRHYLMLLGRAMADSDWRCLAYALMSNHIHLAMIAGATPQSTWTKRVNSPFASWMNARHERIGPVFADRARDIAVVPERVRDLIAYIHNNPVRAGVADTARDSTWSSHRAYVGLSARPLWLRVSEGLRCAAFQSRAELDAWVCTSTKRVDDPDIVELRRRVRRRGAIELATPVVAYDAMVPLVARSFARIRPDPLRLLEVVSETTDIPLDRLRSRSHARDVVAGRMVAVHCGRAVGLVGSDVAAALGVSSAAVTKIQRRNPDRRLRDAIEVVCERLEIDAFGAKLRPSPGGSVMSRP